nr:uncharacterized protein LOC126538358 [Dermacentor andersoni]
MPGCCVPQCTNHSRKGWRMFQFPRDPKRRLLWTVKTKRDKWQPTNTSCMCSVSKTFLRMPKDSHVRAVEVRDSFLLRERVEGMHRDIWVLFAEFSPCPAAYGHALLSRVVMWTRVIEPQTAHFEPSSFEQHCSDGWKKLKPNAVPTLFSFKRKLLFLKSG